MHGRYLKLKTWEWNKFPDLNFFHQDYMTFDLD